MPRIRLVALLFWLASVVGLTVFYVANPELLQPARLVQAIRESDQPLWAGYIGLSLIRAFTLLPSTVLVVAGTLLFPDRHGS